MEIQECQILDLSHITKLDCITKIPKKYKHDTTSNELVDEYITLDTNYYFDKKQLFREKLIKDLLDFFIARGLKMPYEDLELFIMDNFDFDTSVFNIPNKDRKFLVTNTAWIAEKRYFLDRLRSNYFPISDLPRQQHDGDYLISLSLLNKDETYSDNNPKISVWLSDIEGRYLILGNKKKIYI